MSATDNSADTEIAYASDEANDSRSRSRYNRSRLYPQGKQCRICHVKTDADDDYDDDDVAMEEIGEPMELGCDCKGDLATAHMKCAVTWFLIKGDLNCEICGAIVQNVCEMAQNHVTQHEVGRDGAEIQVLEESYTGPVSEPESERSLNGHKLVNVMLGCMVFAFIISWLFHFNMLH